jgi:hypothetical protein
MDRAELFRTTDYKALLKTKQKEEVRLRPKLTWKYIAEKIRIQSTYLSRSFNRDEVHLNEDHFFEVLQLLQFDEAEKDYAFLLRSAAMTASEGRRRDLEDRLEAIRKSHFMKVDQVMKEATPEQTGFLMNPYLVLIYISLHVKKYAKSPFLLTRVFNLKDSQLEEFLREIEKAGLLRYDGEKKAILELRQNKMHFTKDHPLMRGHQQIMRHLTAERVARTVDPNHVSLSVSFSAPESAYREIKDDFYKFLNEAQKHASKSEGERVFQLSFDLFTWD